MIDVKTPPPPFTHEEAWIIDHKVEGIRTHWEFTGVDTSQDYVTLTAGRETVTWRRETFDRVARLTPSSPFSFSSLVEPKEYGLRERIEKRRAWEKAEAKDLAELKRLQAKFGVSP